MQSRLDVGAMQKWTVAMLAIVACMAMTSTSVHAGCSADLSPYKACMPAVLGATPPLPSPDCCKVIRAADIACLCTTVSAANIPELNQDAALMLPKHCGAVALDAKTCLKHQVNPFARKLMDLHLAT